MLKKRKDSNDLEVLKLRSLNCSKNDGNSALERRNEDQYF